MQDRLCKPYLHLMYEKFLTFHLVVHYLNVNTFVCRPVVSGRPAYNSILYINIKFSLHKQSENPEKPRQSTACNFTVSRFWLKIANSLTKIDFLARLKVLFKSEGNLHSILNLS